MKNKDAIIDELESYAINAEKKADIAREAFYKDPTASTINISEDVFLRGAASGVKFAIAVIRRQSSKDQEKSFFAKRIGRQSVLFWQANGYHPKAVLLNSNTAEKAIAEDPYFTLKKEMNPAVFTIGDIKGYICESIQDENFILL